MTLSKKNILARLNESTGNNYVGFTIEEEVLMEIIVEEINSELQHRIEVAFAE